MRIVVLARECHLHDIGHLLSFGCVQDLAQKRLWHPDFFPELAHCNLRHNSGWDWSMSEYSQQSVLHIGRTLPVGLEVS